MSGWLSEKLFGEKVDGQGRPDDTAPGFSEHALAGLADLEARIPPPGAAVEPAFAKTFQPNERLKSHASAGGGLITGPDGHKRPHYWGHRERLRTRFLSGGHKGMPEYELLELVLFNAIGRIDVKPLAKRLLSTFGDLNGVIAASEHRILKIEGATERVYFQLKMLEAIAQRMGQARVLKRDVMSSWDDLIDYCRTSMAHRETEQFRVMFLDRKNYVIADEEQAEGTVDHVPVYPREIAKRALELNASALILAHNHPSGDPTPSRQDIEMTTKIQAACHAIGVTVHEHVIIGKDRDLSFRSEGLLTDAVL